MVSYVYRNFTLHFSSHFPISPPHASYCFPSSMQTSALQMPSDPLFKVSSFIGNPKGMEQRHQSEIQKWFFFVTLSSTFSHDIMSVETKIYSANNMACELQNTLAFPQSQLCTFKYVGIVFHTIWEPDLTPASSFFLHYTGNLLWAYFFKYTLCFPTLSHLRMSSLNNIVLSTLLQLSGFLGFSYHSVPCQSRFSLRHIFWTS